MTDTFVSSAHYTSLYLSSGNSDLKNKQLPVPCLSSGIPPFLSNPTHNHGCRRIDRPNLAFLSIIFCYPTSHFFNNSKLSIFGSSISPQSYSDSRSGSFDNSTFLPTLAALFSLQWHHDPLRRCYFAVDLNPIQKSRRLQPNSSAHVKKKKERYIGTMTSGQIDLNILCS